ncbi:MAG: radical SAM family heme chaperone HemW, partial [Candidatus Caenarcaniphilales bacterium]|nr:radical SAM family heme chaperone HemW [Candidatus Caenarcaniphilales bacterium]
MAESIYIHLPFCKTKCPYCDFASFAGQESQSMSDYTRALINEIKWRMPIASKNTNLKTIFFGGGTPSLQEPSDIALLLDVLKLYFNFDKDIEITLEANPGTINLDKLQKFINAGINRISIGVQTFDQELLMKLGRGHSLEDSFIAIEDIKKLDFKSWSFDLIYGLPGQTLASWQDTLEKAISFDPPHISAYALSIEPNTPYGKIYKDYSHADLPQEDLLVEMYLLTNKLLKKANLERYEISNWSKPSHQAKHNLCYWKAESYYAFGLSAHGFVDSCRYFNTRDLHEYMMLFQDSDVLNQASKFNLEKVQEKIFIGEDENLEEKILLGLRLSPGLELFDSIKSKIDFSKID